MVWNFSFFNPSLNELADEGYAYIQSDKYGDGKGCVIREKMIGMKPVNKQQEEKLTKQKKYLELKKQIKRIF